jgi:hypothetical protein
MQTYPLRRFALIIFILGTLLVGIRFFTHGSSYRIEPAACLSSNDSYVVRVTCQTWKAEALFEELFVVAVTRAPSLGHFGLWKGAV